MLSIFSVVSETAQPAKWH